MPRRWLRWCRVLRAWRCFPRLRPRHGVGEGLRHANSRKSGVLLIQGLGDGTDSHITYERATTRAARV
jgi:hypothetical protein